MNMTSLSAIVRKTINMMAGEKTANRDVVMKMEEQGEGL
jgi:hypothetical protein